MSQRVLVVNRYDYLYNFDSMTWFLDELAMILKHKNVLTYLVERGYNFIVVMNLLLNV